MTNEITQFDILKGEMRALVKENAYFKQQLGYLYSMHAECLADIDACRKADLNSGIKRTVFAITMVISHILVYMAGGA